MSFENLSRAEKEKLLSVLMADLQKSPSEVTKTSEPLKKCLYVAERGDKKCDKSSDTPYGFCKTHIRTVQAKKAKEVFDANSSIVEATPQEEEPPTPTLAKPEPEKAISRREATFDSSKVILESTPKSILKKEPVQAKVETPIVKKNKPEKTKNLYRNKWNRFEDPDTNIVFDPKTKSAIGIQKKNGTLSALTDKHIKICKQNGWRYVVPTDSDDEEETEEEEEEETEEEEESEEETEEEEESEEEEDDDEDEEEEEDDDDEEEEESEESD